MAEPDVWTTKGGTRMYLYEMTESHLRNAIRYLRRRLADGDYGDMSDPHEGDHEVFISIANGCAAQAEGVIGEKIERLQAELSRRGLPREGH